METLNVGMTNQLKTLTDSGYQLGEGEQDIRGWEVKNADGDYIGDVADLLFDVVHAKVRYLIVDLNNNELGLNEHLVLVPIGLAEVHEDEDAVILPSVKTAQLSVLHPYQAADFDSGSEESVQAAYIGADVDTDEAIAVAGLEPKHVYDHEYFNDQNLYKRRRKTDVAQEETVLFPINEDLADQVEMSTDDNMIAGADLDIPAERTTDIAS